MSRKYGGYITIDDIGHVGIHAHDPLVMEEVNKRVAERISAWDKEFKQRCMRDRIIMWRARRIAKKMTREKAREMKHARG